MKYQRQQWQAQLHTATFCAPSLTMGVVAPPAGRWCLCSRLPEPRSPPDPPGRWHSWQKGRWGFNHPLHTRDASQELYAAGYLLYYTAQRSTLLKCVLNCARVKWIQGPQKAGVSYRDCMPCVFTTVSVFSWNERKERCPLHDRIKRRVEPLESWRSS